MSPKAATALVALAAVVVAVAIAAPSSTGLQASAWASASAPDQWEQASDQGKRGALTVDLTGTQGATSPYFIKLRGPAGVSMRPVTLLDAGGEHTGTARAIAGACTPNSTQIAFPRSRSWWCLELENIAAGHELTGVVRSQGEATLVLTVRRRDACLLPLLVLFAGLLAGLLAAFVPAWLRPRVRRNVLERMVAGNRDDSDMHKRIEGLEGWVSTRRARGEDDDSLIADISWTIEYGPAVVSPARAALAREISAVGSSGELPPSLLADAEAIASSPHRISDFYADDGSRLTPHPAELWAVALHRAWEIREEIAQREAAIDGLFPDAEPTSAEAEARGALAVAQERFSALREPRDIGHMDSCLEALANAVARAEILATGPERAAAPPALELALRGAIETITEPRRSLGTLAGRTFRAMFATAIALIVVLAYASFAIMYAVYIPNPLFHSFGDYLTLFSAALGSGAVATALALLGYWRVTDGRG